MPQRGGVGFVRELPWHLSAAQGWWFARRWRWRWLAGGRELGGGRKVGCLGMPCLLVCVLMCKICLEELVFLVGIEVIGEMMMI